MINVKQEILNALTECEPLSIAELEVVTSRSHGAVTRHIRELSDTGILYIHSKLPTKNTPVIRYARVESFKESDTSRAANRLDLKKLDRSGWFKTKFIGTNPWTKIKGS